MFGMLGLDISLVASCERGADTEVFEVTLDTKDVSTTSKIGIAKDQRCGKGTGR